MNIYSTKKPLPFGLSRVAYFRTSLMKQMLSSPLASQSKDVAKAIWNVVKHPQAEVIVGSAKVPALLNRFFPGITQGMSILLG